MLDKAAILVFVHQQTCIRGGDSSTEMTSFQEVSSSHTDRGVVAAWVPELQQLGRVAASRWELCDEPHREAINRGKPIGATWDPGSFQACSQCRDAGVCVGKN